MRAFVALDVPDQILDSLALFQGELPATGADIKLVERENLHFTVKFLGDITEAQTSEALSRLRKLSLKRMNVPVRGAGAFPAIDRARVVWAGVARESVQPVSSMAEQVVSALRDIGESDDRPFQAHITLGRVRSGRSLRQLGDLLARNSDRQFGTAALTELKLKSSVLSPSGPVYSDVGVFPLL
jgi:2'-5' RNA ligase